MNNLYKEIAGIILSDDEFGRVLEKLIQQVEKPLEDYYKQIKKSQGSNLKTNIPEPKTEAYFDIAFAAMEFVTADINPNYHEVEEMVEPFFAQEEIIKCNREIELLTDMKEFCEEAIEWSKGKKDFAQHCIDSRETEKAVKEFQKMEVKEN